MYILYSIAIKNNTVPTSAMTFTDSGEFVSDDRKISRLEAGIEIEKMKSREDVTVIKLPIDADSDYYDKYIVR